QKELNSKSKAITTTGAGGGVLGSGPTALNVSLTPAEQKARQQRLQELEFIDQANTRRGLIVGIEAEIARLRGDNLTKLNQETATAEKTAAEKEAELRKEAERQKQIEAAQKARAAAAKEAEKEAERRQR